MDNPCLGADATPGGAAVQRQDLRLRVHLRARYGMSGVVQVRDRTKRDGCGVKTKHSRCCVGPVTLNAMLQAHIYENNKPFCGLMR